MRAIERVTAHYDKNKRQKIAVPEWGSDAAPFEIFWNLPTINEMERLQQKLGLDRDNVDLLVEMARDEANKPLFSIEDKPALRRKADLAIISRIANAMVRSGQITALTTDKVEQAEKNS